jgi:hypothetical protein
MLAVGDLAPRPFGPWHRDGVPVSAQAIDPVYQKFTDNMR